MYRLSSWHKSDPVCIGCPAGTSQIRCVSAVQLAQVRSGVHQTRAELQKGQRASYAMQNTSAQLPFHFRHDPLKLARDPVKVVAGGPTDLKILSNGRPLVTDLCRSKSVTWCFMPCLQSWLYQGKMTKSTS